MSDARVVAVPKDLDEAIKLVMRIVEHLGGLEDENVERDECQERLHSDYIDLLGRVDDIDMRLMDLEDPNND